jgi:hypothetical protein
MARKTKHDDEMRSHYDFSGGVRGKYAARYAEGTNLVVLAPNVTEMSADSAAVNDTIATLVRNALTKVADKATPEPRRPKKTETSDQYNQSNYPLSNLTKTNRREPFPILQPNRMDQGCSAVLPSSK